VPYSRASMVQLLGRVTYLSNPCKKTLASATNWKRKRYAGETLLSDCWSYFLLGFSNCRDLYSQCPCAAQEFCCYAAAEVIWFSVTAASKKTNTKNCWILFLSDHIFLCMIPHLNLGLNICRSQSSMCAEKLLKLLQWQHITELLNSQCQVLLIMIFALQST
jgi:hypothetical protein